MYALSIDYRMKRVLEFVADYDVNCSVLNNTAAYNLIKDMAKQRYSKVDELCAGGMFANDKFISHYRHDMVL